MSEVITIGLDLAKSVFQVNGVDGSGEVVVCRHLRRQVPAFLEALPPSLVGLVTCASAHNHRERLRRLIMMPGRYVRLHVQR